MTMINIF